MKNSFKLLIMCIILPVIINAQTFTNIDAGLTGLHFSDIAWGDYDGDGDFDVIIAGSDSDNNPVTELYKNESNNIFTKINNFPIPGTYIGDIAWGDYDNDGDLDILIQGYIGGNGQITSIYENKGSDVFVDSEIDLPGLADGSVSFVDFNNDGLTDLLIDGYNGEGTVVFLYKNTGNGNFIQITPSFPATTKACYEWGDYDNDNDMDIFITGLDGSGNLNSKLYQNNGDETFTEVATNTFINIWLGDAAWGDYDNDGDLDIIISGYTQDIPYPDDRVTEIYKNNGDGSFTALTNHGLTGVSHSSSIWGDYDNDGDLDVFISGTFENNGWTRITDIFVNNGDDTFTSAGLSFPFDSYWGESAWGDYDADGDLDIICSGYDDVGASNTIIYRNDSENANTIPEAPENLNSDVNLQSVELNWTDASDNETPAEGLLYNVYIRNETDKIYCNSMADINTGMRFVPALGNAGQNTNFSIDNLPNGNYFWSVQAIDNNFAGSLFASEGTFEIEIEQASISVEPEVINFGDVEIGTYEISSFTIENTGTLDLDISQITATENFMLAYTPDGTFQITLDQTTLAPEETKTIYVQFYSIYTQYYDEQITIFSNASNQNETQISASANCIYIGMETLSNKNSKIFNSPNPAEDITTFYFNFETNKKSVLKIYDINGKLLKIYDITNKKELILNVNKFKKGTYFYKAETENNNFVGKLSIK